MSKAFTVKFSGFDKELAKFSKALNGGIKPIVEDCLKVAPKLINPNIDRDMQGHNRTGKTMRSMERNNDVTWNATEASIPVGFHIRRGGLASVFLMYGTARHYPGDNKGRWHSEPIDNLADDIIGPKVEKRISEEQQKIWDREITRAFGG